MHYVNVFSSNKHNLTLTGLILQATYLIMSGATQSACMLNDKNKDR